MKTVIFASLLNHLYCRKTSVCHIMIQYLGSVNHRNGRILYNILSQSLGDISAGGLLISGGYHPLSSPVLFQNWHDLIDIFIIEILNSKILHLSLKQRFSSVSHKWLQQILNIPFRFFGFIIRKIINNYFVVSDHFNLSLPDPREHLHIHLRVFSYVSVTIRNVYQYMQHFNTLTSNIPRIESIV